MKDISLVQHTEYMFISIPFWISPDKKTNIKKQKGWESCVEIIIKLTEKRQLR